MCPRRHCAGITEKISARASQLQLHGQHTHPSLLKPCILFPNLLVAQSCHPLLIHISAMHLHSPTARFQCLFAAARQRIASLEHRVVPKRTVFRTHSTSPQLLSPPPRRALSRSLLLSSRRPISSSPRRSAPKTVQQARSRYMVGVSFIPLTRSLPSPPCCYVAGLFCFSY